MLMHPFPRAVLPVKDSGHPQVDLCPTRHAQYRPVDYPAQITLLPRLRIARGQLGTLIPCLLLGIHHLDDSSAIRRPLRGISANYRDGGGGRSELIKWSVA